MSTNVISPFQNGRDFSPLATHDANKTLLGNSNILSQRKRTRKKTPLETMNEKIKTQVENVKHGTVAPPEEVVNNVVEDKKQTDKAKSSKNKCEKLAVIRPLIPVLRKAMKDKTIVPVVGKKGKYSCEELEAITTQFYNEIARKNQTNNFTGQHELPEMYAAEYPRDYGDEVIDGILAGVLTYIAAVREKKEQGSDLSKVEETVATGAEKVEGSLQTKAKEQASLKLGSWMMDGGWIWIIGSIVAILIVAMVFKK